MFVENRCVRRMTFMHPDDGQPSLFSDVLLDVYGQTDAGCVRADNQDTVLVENPPQAHSHFSRGTLVVVADGLGGHAAGALASRMAADHVWHVLGSVDSAIRPVTAIATAIMQANAAVHAASSQHQELKGMGTTLSLLLIRGGKVYIGHVGDTRIYRITRHSIEQLTTDDTVVAELLRNKVINEEEARLHRDRGALTRALGTKRETEFTVFGVAETLTVGDKFLLCSDGLHDVVSDPELFELASHFGTLAACHQLIGLARERGAPDNVSVAIVSVRSALEPSLSVRVTGATRAAL